MATVGAGTTMRLAVSLYLLRKGKVSDAQKQLQDDADASLALVDSLPGATLFVLPAEPSEPKWLSPVTTLLPAGTPVPALAGQTPGALLWIPRAGKVFLVSFGYGHTKIRDEWVEPEFGKTVALAIVPQGQVREVRAEQVFARRHIASERAPRVASVRDFGFESDRDLVTAVEGTPEAKYQLTFGDMVRGGLSCKFEVDFSDLRATLDTVAERFDSNDHRARWPEVANLAPVRDSDLSDELDRLLGASLALKTSLAISFAAPSERSGDKPYPHHYVIGRMSKTPVTIPYLSRAAWDSYLTATGTAADLSSARGTRVHMLDENKDEIDTCSMYDCLGFEVAHKGASYFLSSGNWFCADTKFIKSTNAAIAKVKAPSYLLSKWNSIDHEGAYNADVCAKDTALWLFDKELVSFGGGASRLEFCDVMHLPTRTLYFVKHPSASAGVSHLCEQVRRTAEGFFAPDPAYRKKLVERIVKVGKGWDTSWAAGLPKRHEWNLCLVLMGKPLGKLPFFAKCSVARLLGELARGGYTVSFQAV